jgi:hypothetical protein
MGSLLSETLSLPRSPGIPDPTSWAPLYPTQEQWQDVAWAKEKGWSRKMLVTRSVNQAFCP